jgi:AmmeMemoRadiSam system protein A
VDRDVVSALVAADPDCVLEESIHDMEHSIEVQVPFVQVLFPKAKIVPVVVGAPDVDLCTRFGRALANAVKGGRTLIVASTDLSHYPDAGAAAAVDAETLASILRLDEAALHEKVEAQLKRNIPGLSTCACGEAPVLAAMAAAKALGASGGTVVSYLHSGDVGLGERSQVVGYGAVVLTAEKGKAFAGQQERPSAARSDLVLKTPEKKTLLAFARQSISRYLATRTIPAARGFDPRLSAPRGVFVTLTKKGELRGCIGHVPPDTPLVNIVGAMAVKSAFGDPRFEPLGEEELNQIEIEISMLTVPKEVPGAAEVVVGKDGVVLQKDGRAALFLPQVAPHEGWGRDEMLEHLCNKAGLNRGCWKEGARLSTFQAVVFSEKDFK